MVNSIPEEIKNFCTRHTGPIRSFRPASGGCINNGGTVSGDWTTLFLKWNSASQFPGMFPAEEKGLRLLASPDCITVPKAVDVYEGKQHAGILMEVIQPSPRSKDYWENLAKGLACLHQVTREQFGLDHSNYIGSLPQFNHNYESWIDFFINCRLRPQLKMALDAGKVSHSDLRKFDALEKKLPELLPEEAPALIHGDLWSGNLMTDSHGNPALIDPAVAFSHREMELAFTELFGGFDQQFYEAYQEIFPMEKGYRSRFGIYNIYPLLVHVNLFGGGYYQQVMHILSRI